MYRFDTNGQMTMLGLDTAERGGAPPKRRPGKSDSELVSILAAATILPASVITNKSSFFTASFAVFSVG